MKKKRFTKQVTYQQRATINSERKTISLDACGCACGCTWKGDGVKIKKEGREMMEMPLRL